MGNRYTIPEILAKQNVKHATFIGSILGFLAACVTLLLGEEPLFVLLFFAMGCILGILRLVAEMNAK